MTTIGERIKETRQALQISQKVLAKRVGITQPTLSQLESGKSYGTQHLASIALALGVRAIWLETGKGEKYPLKSISEKEMLLVISYREATDEGKTFIEMACSSAPKADRLQRD